MPLDFVPRAGQFNPTKTGALRDAWNEAIKAYGKDPGSLLTKFGEFEPGQILKPESGRVELNANEIISQGLRLPAYSLEAPLRPFNVATGGAVESGLESAWNFGKSIPILGLAFNALEGVSGVLEASNKVARAVSNRPLAMQLAAAIGKPDNYSLTFGTQTRTAGEIRRLAMEKWSVNPFTGEKFTLRELEARAAKNDWDFGEFDVSTDGFTNFLAQTVADPLNLAMIAGGPAIGLAGRALRAASWARPAVNLGTRIAGAPRIGYGALRSLGRAVIETPTGAKFADEFTTARHIINGQLASHGTLSGALRASSWMLRGLYLPGYAGNVERGMSKGMAALTAWQRGGIQQMAVTTAAENLAGVANGWMGDNSLENVHDGFTSWLQDTLHTINNDHILSDNDSFVVAALFSPWATALGDIPRGAKALRTRNGLPRYADNTLFHIKDEFRKSFNVRDDYNTIFTKIGQGDAEAGRRAWEWFVDQAEVMKASNQLSNFTRNIAELDDLAARSQFLTDTVVQKIKMQRERGALQPNSLADYMLDMYRNGPLGRNGETLAHQFEITADGFYGFVGRMYRANQQFAPQLSKLGNLQVAQGAPITREVVDAMIATLDGLPATDIVPRDIAAQIMDTGPSVVWDSEFFSRFSSTLGQRQHSGRFGRANTAGEGVTVGTLRDQLNTLRDSAPPAAELYHEATAAAAKATRIKPGETLVSNPPYPLPAKLDARRVYNTGRVRSLTKALESINNLRHAEFFKNGKPRIQAAKEMVGPEGGLFRRTADGKMARSDGAEFTVVDGTLEANVLDSEVITLGVQNGGRVTMRPVSDGPLLAEHGFVEVARVRGTDRASYAYRGGDVTKIIENRNAGAFSPYRAAKREALETGALNAARRAADQASLLHPSMEAIGPSVTKANRHLDPAERLKELNALQDAIVAQRKSLVKQISESDELAWKLAGIDKNANLSEWFNHASKTQVEQAIDLVRNVNSDFPSMSVREAQGLWVDPRVDRFSTLLTHRNVYRRLAFEYGHLSPISYLYTALLSPVNARWLGKQTQTEIHNLLAQSGLTSAESRKFVAAMRDEVMISRSVEGTLGEVTGTHMYRSIFALPEGKVRQLLEAAAPGKSAEVINRWGHVQKMLTEAGNRLMRNSARRARSGGKVDPLMAALDGAFRIWQYSPGLSATSMATRNFTKFLYPMLRFGLDPFYHMMNALEPDILGIGSEGLRVSRSNTQRLVRGETSSNAAEQAALTSIPPGGLRDADLPVDLLLADTGAYTMPRNIRPVLERHFDIKRIDSTADVFRAMKDEDPIAVMLRERFGDNVQDWAKSVDELMYGYVTKGPEATVRETAERILAESNLTAAEAKALAPMIERLASMHRGQYDDLVQLYIGRMNRPQIERMFDHVALFWPLSYQIKATMWMGRLMFQRIGGVNTGASGAYLYDEYRQRWENNVANDVNLKRWLEDNDDFTFFLEMMLPATPSGVGASLFRPTRFAGSLLAELVTGKEGETFFGAHPDLMDDALEKSFGVGPVRSWNLFTRIMEGAEVPGFTRETTSAPRPVTLPDR